MSADKRNAPQADNDSAPILPEDIATLYSWANLHGIKYRDFSATRQDFRSQPRTPRPGSVAEEIEQTPPAAEPLGDVLEATAPNPEAVVAEPVEPAWVEAIAAADEIKEEIAEKIVPAAEVKTAAPEPVTIPEIQAQDVVVPAAEPEPKPVAKLEKQPEPPARSSSRGAWAEFLGADPAAEPAPHPVEKKETAAQKAPPIQEAPVEAVPVEPPAKTIVFEPAVAAAAGSTTNGAAADLPPFMVEEPIPSRKPEAPGRERTSSRWYALNRIAGDLEPHAYQEPSLHAPVLAVFSLAGGVGKTGLVATLGRALASRGEEVLLVDTNPYGLLHLYYGAQAPRPGAVRSFSGGGQDATIKMLSLDAFASPATRLGDLLQQNASGVSRILVDVATASADLVRQIARFTPQVLVPLTPDMQSLASLQALEDCFARIEESEGRRIEPVYLINGFDPSVSLHVEIREILTQRLGDRLLPFALHRTAAVAEALAEGMTVVDYSPGALVAEDYASLASWVRRLAAPADGARRGRRWSEQERS